MASFTATFQDEAFLAALTQLKTRGDDLRPLFHEVGAELKRTTRLRFDNQSDPDGRRWNPLDEAYAKWKSSKPKSVDPRGPVIDKILHFALDLRDSIDYQAGTDELVVGSNVLYARVHQLGRKDDKRTARPFLGLSKDDRDFIADAGADYLAAPSNS
jgi:phage virion morphogenesis protein